jgi:hypothetical protein
MDLHDGVKIKLGGKDYIVPPLSFKRLKNLKPEMEVIKTVAPQTELTDDQIEAMIRIIHAAISRNYPDLKEEDLFDLLDLGNIGKITAAVMGQSGFEQRGE